MAKTMNTATVIASWMIFSWKPLNAPNPKRLAGTARQYSSKAISHDTTMAFQIGHEWPYLRCPYQAKVMNTLEQNSRMMVFMESLIGCGNHYYTCCKAAITLTLARPVPTIAGLCLRAQVRGISAR